MKSVAGGTGHIAGAKVVDRESSGAGGIIRAGEGVEGTMDSLRKVGSAGGLGGAGGFGRPFLDWWLSSSSLSLLE